MRFFKRTDLIIISAIILFSVLLWFIYTAVYSDARVKAEIYYNSELVESIVLTPGQERRFSIPQKKNVVFRIDSEGNIEFEKSDCPDQICVRTGKLRIAGQSAACLPNGLILKIVPLRERRDDDLDIILGR